MDWTNLEKKKVKARKEHFCNWCHSKIEKGEIYTFNINMVEGSIRDWKECYRCKKLVKEMFSMGYGDEYGYCDDDSFSEFMEIEYSMTFQDHIKWDLVAMEKMEKEMFVDMIMDMLIIIDLDGVVGDKKKELRMKADLLSTDWPKLTEYYDRTNELVESKYRQENIERILKEVNELGVEVIREKYGLV